MKYFAPITKLKLSILWETVMPTGWDEIMFIQCKKDRTPIKNASVYQVEEMNELKYEYKLKELKNIRK